MHGAEAPLGRRPDLAQGRRIGDVGREDQHLPAQRLDRQQALDLLPDAVLSVVEGDPVRPALALGERGAPHQHQPRLRLPGQRFGQLEADAAHAAGDEAGPAPPQPRRGLSRRRRRWQRLDLADPAPVAAECDGRQVDGLRSPEDLGQDLARDPLEVLGAAEGHVEAAAGGVWILARDDRQRSQEGRLERLQRLGAGDVAEAARDNGDLGRIGHRLPPQRLGQVDEAEVGAVEGRARLRVAVGDVPEVEDVGRGVA